MKQCGATLALWPFYATQTLPTAHAAASGICLTVEPIYTAMHCWQEDVPLFPTRYCSMSRSNCEENARRSNVCNRQCLRWMTPQRRRVRAEMTSHDKTCAPVGTKPGTKPGTMPGTMQHAEIMDSIGQYIAVVGSQALHNWPSRRGGKDPGYGVLLLVLVPI